MEIGNESGAVNTVIQPPTPAMPAAPEGMKWSVEVKPGRGMPTEVKVTLRKVRWPHKIVGQRSSHCGSFFDRPSDEWFFKSVVSGLATDILNPPEDPAIRNRWLGEMGQSNA